MRISLHTPQVSDRVTTDRVKVAPMHALRAVFARIGQLLMVADRIPQQAEDRASAAATGPGPGPAVQPCPGHGPAARRETAGRRESADRPASPARARWRSLDETGNVRLLSAEDLAGDLPDPPVAVAEPAPAAQGGLEASDVPPPAPVTDAGREGAAPPWPAPGDAALPVPNYDSLSLPSLRARLRALDAAQVRMLLEYERSHAARADVMTMFERRIAKLAAAE